MKIFVVEDNGVTRESCAAILRLDGHTVATASNGLEALQWLQRGLRPDVVFLDLLMPVMDGHQLIQAMRADWHWEQIPVVVLTALAQDQIDGVTDYPEVKVLRKPIDPAVLETLLKSYRSKP